MALALTNTKRFGWLLLEVTSDCVDHFHRVIAAVVLEPDVTGLRPVSDGPQYGSHRLPGQRSDVVPLRGRRPAVFAGTCSSALTVARHILCTIGEWCM